MPGRVAELMKMETGRGKDGLRNFLGVAEGRATVERKGKEELK